MNDEMTCVLDGRVRDIVANIDDLMGQVEDSDGEACCGMACNCYENLWTDIQGNNEALGALGYVYRHGELRTYGKR